jgi:ribose transport system ATP-binding protein
MMKLENITKIFPGVKALDSVSIEFNAGEIHALLGENGAGKSTLIKIISGIFQPNEGKIFLNNKQVFFKDFRDAINHEIAIVNQEIQVIPKSSIAENIVLDKMEQFQVNGKLDWKKINEFASKFLKIVGLNLPPNQSIGNLTAAQKQLIQIAKGLSCNAKLLLLDEPTSSLTKKEADNLIKIVKELKQQGVAIVFVSHKIEEVLALCDKISVLRDGKYIGTKSCEGLVKQDVIKMMIGRETEDRFLGHLDIDYREKVLSVKGLTQRGRFEDVSFDLHKGEILGFYGLVGSGRTELIRAVLGIDKKDGGVIHVNGKEAKISSMSDSLNTYRIGYVSENRKEEGLILADTIKSNITITVWNKIVSPVLKRIKLKKETIVALDMIDKLSIKTPSAMQLVKNLSGGNQQKVSISKWLAAKCDILVIDEPSVGVDVGAKEYIHELIWNLAKKDGKSIIVISSDMPEIVTLSRRLLVFKENEIVGEINNLNEGNQYNYEFVSSQIGAYFA